MIKIHLSLTFKRTFMRSETVAKENRLQKNYKCNKHKCTS